jgi:maleylpyruvate isomerase
VLIRHSGDKAEQKLWAQEAIARGFQAIETLMAWNEAEGVRGRFVYGDALTAADVVLVPQLAAAKRFGVDLGPYPKLVLATEAAAATDEAKRAAPEAQPDARGVSTS